MLDSMAVKGQAEKNAEETRFAAFSQWCTDQTRIKTEEIQAGADTMELQSATIQKAEARIRALTARIMELEEDVGRWNTDKKSASAVRAKESTDYKATAKDYTESLDALTQAIIVLKKQSFDRAQAGFVQ